MSFIDLYNPDDQRQALTRLRVMRAKNAKPRIDAGDFLLRARCLRTENFRAKLHWFKFVNVLQQTVEDQVELYSARITASRFSHANGLRAIEGIAMVAIAEGHGYSFATAG